MKVNFQIQGHLKTIERLKSSVGNYRLWESFDCYVEGSEQDSMGGWFRSSRARLTRANAKTKASLEINYYGYKLSVSTVA